MMFGLVETFDKIFYPDYLDNWDNKLLRNKVNEYINLNYKVLDLGAGAGIDNSLNIKSIVDRVCGVDLDTRVLTNPYLDEAKIGCAESIPYQDNFFDVVICNNVLEHLSEPEKVFKEINRVMKKGGNIHL